MSTGSDTANRRVDRRTGTATRFAVGGAATAALTLLVWAIGYFASQPFGFGPDANPDRQPLPNPFIGVVAVWAAAALAELLAAALVRRRPGAAVALVVLAAVAGLAALLVAAMPIEYWPALVPGLVAWGVPVVPLAFGVVALLHQRRAVEVRGISA